MKGSHNNAAPKKAANSQYKGPPPGQRRTGAVPKGYKTGGTSARQK